MLSPKCNTSDKILAITALHDTLSWLHIEAICTPVTAFTDGPGTLMYNTPSTLSVTLTLNWYCCPPSSPDTTPEETLAGKVTDPELLCLLLLLLPPFTIL